MSKIKVGKKSYEEKEVKKNILKLNILSFVLIFLIIYSSAFAFNLAIIGILALLLIISILSANEFKSALRVKASIQNKVIKKRYRSDKRYLENTRVNILKFNFLGDIWKCISNTFIISFLSFKSKAPILKKSVLLLKKIY